MLPRAAMVATKNPAAGFVLILAALTFLTACSPPGERAMARGKKYLDQGRAAEAIEQFTKATDLMRTNAAAWNYLGLACHGAGRVTNAIAAYQRALNLDRTLLDARFNLGCLWLEQENFDAAKTEFIAYTLRRPNDADGWLKLASTRLRSGDVVGAEGNFQDALKFSTNNVEALNGLALVQLQRKHPRDAAQLLAQALKIQPDFRPAILNLAAIRHQHLNEPAEALKLYRQYLALERARQIGRRSAPSPKLSNRLRPWFSLPLQFHRARLRRKVIRRIPCRRLFPLRQNPRL